MLNGDDNENGFKTTRCNLSKSCYCRVARQALPCHRAVAQLGFKRRASPCRTQFINYKYITIYLKVC